MSSQKPVLVAFLSQMNPVLCPILFFKVPLNTFILMVLICPCYCVLLNVRQADLSALC